MNPCENCGNDPCDCQEQMDAHYAVNPDEVPITCSCGDTVTAGSLIGGMCRRCWYLGDEQRDEDAEELYG